MGWLQAEDGARTAAAPPPKTVVRVENGTQLSAALRSVVPGTTILIAPGTYSRGFGLRDVAGTEKEPIIIAGSDPDNPPTFTGYGEGAKLSGCKYVKLSTIKFQYFEGNGVNIDDAGSARSPSSHIVLENITILDTGPKGNHDALKMSGVDHFVVRRCHFEGWGGSGIDMVGCHNGVIEDCWFIGREGYRQRSGVQIKGGSSGVLVQTSFFDKVGERAVNLGGSTGLQFFRPLGADYEAKDIIVAGNRFVGCESAIAWVTCGASHVHHNIIYLPGLWVMRILQETTDRKFKRCRDGVFEKNLIVLDDGVKATLNTGPGTNPDSFTFRGNAWFRVGSYTRRSAQRPEVDGVHQIDPQLAEKGTDHMRIGSKDPAYRDIGPDAYVPFKLEGEFRDINLPVVPQGTGSRQGRGRGTVLLCAMMGLGLMVAVAVKVLHRRHVREGRSLS